MGNIFNRKITGAKIEKICWQITIATWMQPFQNDLRCPAAKDNRITHASVATRGLEAAITMRSAKTQLKNKMELRAQQQRRATLTQPLQWDLKQPIAQHKKDQKEFRAQSSKSESWRCENEAFVRDFLQKPTAWSCQNEAWIVSYSAPLIRDDHDHRRDRLATAARTSFPIHLPRHVLTCKTQHFVHPLSLKDASRASLPSKSESWRCENEAFVRDLISLHKLKMWKRSFRARLPSTSESWRCESEAFVRDSPHKLKVEDVKTKLLCETSIKKL